MARPRREQRINGIYHVSNAAQAHAPLFESEADVGRCLGLLAWESQQSRIQVHCFAFLTTHYHAIIESLDGDLAGAMQSWQQGYAEHYNRTRERPGHAFQNRYFSREIHGPVDMAVTTDYIDWNPVAAGMVSVPQEYAHGSARYYCGDSVLSWLARDRLEAIVRHLAPSQHYKPLDYPLLWKFANRAGTRDLIGRAMAHRQSRVLPLALLATAGPAHTQRWLAERLREEEGRSRPCLVLPGTTIMVAFSAPGGAVESNDRQLLAWMLHALAGWTVQEIAARLRVAASTVGRWTSAHRARLRNDASYLASVADRIAALSREIYGPIASMEDVKWRRAFGDGDGRGAR